MPWSMLPAASRECASPHAPPSNPRARYRARASRRTRPPRTGCIPPGRRRACRSRTRIRARRATTRGSTRETRFLRFTLSPANEVDQVTHLQAQGCRAGTRPAPGPRATAPPRQSPSASCGAAAAQRLSRGFPAAICLAAPSSTASASRMKRRSKSVVRMSALATWAEANPGSSAMARRRAGPAGRPVGTESRQRSSKDIAGGRVGRGQGKAPGVGQHVDLSLERSVIVPTSWYVASEFCQNASIKLLKPARNTHTFWYPWPPPATTPIRDPARPGTDPRFGPGADPRPRLRRDHRGCRWSARAGITKGAFSITSPARRTSAARSSTATC
jgi:hypothetical protein